MFIHAPAYPRTNVPFADGVRRSFYRRERPHLIFDADGYTPRALVTGAIDAPLGPGMAGYEGPQRDASYTLLQPTRLKGSASEAVGS